MTDWVDFKNQNPDIEDFFLTKFNSEEQFTSELNESKYFQKLYHRSSILIKNNDQLLQKCPFSAKLKYDNKQNCLIFTIVKIRQFCNIQFRTQSSNQ